MPKNFDRSTYSRNRVVGWLPEGQRHYSADPAKPGTLARKGGEPVTTDDVGTIDDKGAFIVDPAACTHYGVAPQNVWRITPQTMGEPYASGDGMAMLTALAAQKDEDPDDTLVQLVLSAKGNLDYNASLSAMRPRSDAQEQRVANALAAQLTELAMSGLTPEQQLDALRAKLAERGIAIPTSPVTGASDAPMVPKRPRK